jgi:hypothetical protein
MDEGLTLEAQWSLWEAGIAPEVPSYVPLSWEVPAPTTNELLAAAAVRCGDVADRARELLDRTDPDHANHLRVLVAVCLVTADYVVSADELTAVALAACALTLHRFCEGLDPWSDDFGLYAPASSAIRALQAATQRIEDS